MNFRSLTYIFGLHFCEFCLKTSKNEAKNGKYNRFLSLYQLSCWESIDTMLINPQ